MAWRSIWGRERGPWGAVVPTIAPHDVEAIAQRVGSDGPLGAVASGVFAAAVQAGMAGLDDGALLNFLDRPKMAQ
ncbi:MAG: hypothetical protein RIR45_1724 [Pseudomonadota bacterium]|jgi:hypothetical protein